MKNFLLKLRKIASALAAAGVVLIIVYLVLLELDIKRVDDFCNEMKPGLEVSRIPMIAQKYNVGFEAIRDPDSIKNRTLGIQDDTKTDTWFFAVGAPMTVGEHACMVYHNYQVVLSAAASG
ncbi:MAG TPA: hypothetical protein VFX02_08615 [Gammaproteobacteria bacterium]|nr:hypothetical protein [Gammaproteobacteria bacterium]